MSKPILFTGGGTLGPVTPLLAIHEEWRREDESATFAWIGTPKGPEDELVKAKRIPFYSLRVPKLSRHKKWQWPFIPFALAWSCFGAFRLLRKLKPRIVFSAGGYVSVPIAWVAKLMGIPVWIHQLDVRAGLANKLMAPVAVRVSVTFESSINDYGEGKTIAVGGLVRDLVGESSSEDLRKEFKLSKSKPTLLIIGGGTGAVEINEVMAVIGKEIESKMNVIHLTGKGKRSKKLEKIGGNYHVVDFLNTKMAAAYGLADGVVARAGMGTLLEISKLRKPALIIPISNSHQEANARAFEDVDAVEVVTRMNPQILKQRIEHLILDSSRQEELQSNLRNFMGHDGAQKIVKHAMRILRHRA